MKCHWSPTLTLGRSAVSASADFAHRASARTATEKTRRAAEWPGGGLTSPFPPADTPSSDPGLDWPPNVPWASSSSPMRHLTATLQQPGKAKRLYHRRLYLRGDLINLL